MNMLKNSTILLGLEQVKGDMLSNLKGSFLNPKAGFRHISLNQ